VDILAVTKVLEIGDSYILMGEFRSDFAKAALPAGAHVMGPGPFDGVIFKNTKEINATWADNIDDTLWPADGHLDADTWAFQINKNFAAPLTMTYTASPLIPAGSQAKIGFLDFDAGESQAYQLRWSPGAMPVTAMAAPMP
jgi:hypothetical protein